MTSNEYAARQVDRRVPRIASRVAAQQFEIGSTSFEVRRLKSENRNWKIEITRSKFEDRNPKFEKNEVVNMNLSA